jgi:hypothetical protein
MQPLVIIKRKIILDSIVGFPCRLIIFQIDFLVLHGSPQALNHDIMSAVS